MKNDMDYYVSAYIKFCNKIPKKMDDYGDIDISRHNKTMKKYSSLKKQINIHPDCQMANKVYNTLLDNEDIYVQHEAAVDCLGLNIHVERSVEILKHIVQFGDTEQSMCAERSLLIWEGRLRPDQPY